MKKYFAMVVTVIAISMLSLIYPSERAIADETIKIGLCSALSGPAAFWGIPQTRTVALECDLYNEAGGVKIGDKVYKFTYTIEDDKGTGEGGATVANKLVFRDKVDFILGVPGTPSSLAMAPICQDNKVLFYSSGTTGPGLSPKYTWAFRPYVVGYERSLASIAWLVKNRPEIKRIALYGSDTEGGHFDCKHYRELIEARTKWNVVAEDYAPMGNKDFYTIISKFMGKKPDLLYLDSAPAGDAALLIKQSRELGFNGLIIYNVAGDVGDIVKIAGEKNCEGIMTPNHAPDMSPELRKLYEAYYARYKEYNDLVLMMADNMYIFVQAMQGAKSADKYAIRDYMASGATFKSHFGPDGFFYGKEIPWYGISHQFLAAVPVSRIHNGKAELIAVIPPKEILKLVSSP